MARALAELSRRARVLGVSTIYRTPPLGRPDQPSFYNGVCQIQCIMSPRDLKFEVLRKIEADLGRVRGADKWAPRPIDLDILLCGDAVVEEGDLVIPDRDLCSRPFLAIPLLELAPDLVVPAGGGPLRSLVKQLDPSGMEPLVDYTRELRQVLGLA